MRRNKWDKSSRLSPCQKLGEKDHSKIKWTDWRFRVLWLPKGSLACWSNTTTADVRNLKHNGLLKTIQTDSDQLIRSVKQPVYSTWTLLIYWLRTVVLHIFSHLCVWVWVTWVSILFHYVSILFILFHFVSFGKTTQGFMGLLKSGAGTIRGALVMPLMKAVMMLHCIMYNCYVVLYVTSGYT